jgi:hypothetical protein
MTLEVYITWLSVTGVLSGTIHMYKPPKHTQKKTQFRIVLHIRD